MNAIKSRVPLQVEGSVYPRCDCDPPQVGMAMGYDFIIKRWGCLRLWAVKKTVYDC